jgi:hypothetical protein
MATPRSPQARAVTGSDLAILIAVGAIAGIVLALWLTGELAALIASGRPAPVGARDLGHILTRIPDHLADPARAWPPRRAGCCPAPSSSTSRRSSSSLRSRCSPPPSCG